ncbi:LOW QUALITY PROTEIN: cholesteryl ester transfer protein [Thomomys bottae]
MLAVALLSLSLLAVVHACFADTYMAGVVCPITKPALLVLNQEAAKVIQKAFHAPYPDIKGEKSVMLLGRVKYGLHNFCKDWRLTIVLAPLRPGWIKGRFTNFISFTPKLVLSHHLCPLQICKEINVISNIMADFVQKRAASVLSDGDIGVDISLTRSPLIIATYLESHHKSLNSLGVPWARTQPWQQAFDMCCPGLGSPVFHSSSMVTFFSPQADGEAPWAHSFQEEVITTIQAPYSKKKLFLSLVGSWYGLAVVGRVNLIGLILISFLISGLNQPVLPAGLRVAFTALMNRKGLDLFDIITPEIITRDGFLLLQMDFGFPEHLLVDFLQTLN